MAFGVDPSYYFLHSDNLESVGIAKFAEGSEGFGQADAAAAEHAEFVSDLVRLLRSIRHKDERTKVLRLLTALAEEAR